MGIVVGADGSVCVARINPPDCPGCYCELVRRCEAVIRDEMMAFRASWPTQTPPVQPRTVDYVSIHGTTHYDLSDCLRESE